MLGQRSRLNASKIGLVIEDGKKVAVQIPAGAELLAIDSVPDPVWWTVNSKCKSNGKARPLQCLPLIFVKMLNRF